MKKPVIRRKSKKTSCTQALLSNPVKAVSSASKRSKRDAAEDSEKELVNSLLMFMGTPRRKVRTP